ATYAKSGEVGGLKGYKLKQITDGLSKTIAFGEKYHDDPQHDALWNNGCNADMREPLYKWSAWGCIGGWDCMGHVMGAMYYEPVSTNGTPIPPINYRLTNETCAFTNHDNRVSGWGSGHSGGAQFLFGDGGVRFLPNEISREIFRHAALRADGEI